MPRPTAARASRTQEVRLDSTASLPYSIAISHRAALPQSSQKAKVSVTTSIDKSVVYGFSIRSSFDGKAIDCSTNSNSKEQREAAIKVCQSVRKA